MACSKDELAERHKRLMQLLAKQSGMIDSDAKTNEAQLKVDGKEVTDSTALTTSRTSEENKADS